MANIMPKTWTSAAIWLVAAVLLLAAFAWWSSVFETPPAPSPEEREEMRLDDDELEDPTQPPATQPPIEGTD